MIRLARSCAAVGLFAALFLSQAPDMVAQNYPGPEPVPMPPVVAAPADTPYPGTISLLVDLTDVTHRVMNVQETIPVEGDELTLLYPEWLPGNHSPTGPISKLAGLEMSAQGKRIAWVRDRVNVFAFHVRVPAGARSVEVNFQFLAPVQKKEGRISFSSKIVDLSWNSVVLYPAGHFSRRVHFTPSIRRLSAAKFTGARPRRYHCVPRIHMQSHGRTRDTGVAPVVRPYSRLR